MTFLLTFILINLINVIIQTVKSLFTVKGGKWSASLINAITYFVYTYVIVITASDGLETFYKALIVGGCNLVGVWIVKFVEQKMQKDKLWVFNCTAKEDSETVIKVQKLLKDMDIACVYNEIIKDRLYTMNVYSYTAKESAMIKDILENYDIKYCALETKTVA